MYLTHTALFVHDDTTQCLCGSCLMEAMDAQGYDGEELPEEWAEVTVHAREFHVCEKCGRD